jgi:hypothetical protein
MTDRDIILVYTHPKVGSTSFVTSLRLSASDKFYVLHTHDDPILEIQWEDKNLCSSDIIKNAGIGGRKVYIIDIYRTPIERKISEYFHEISTLHFNNLETSINKYDIRRITKRFNDLFPHFSDEDFFETKFGIHEAFDLKKKYLMHTNNGVVYIKLRLQDSKEWGRILSDILKTEIIIVKDYETSNKFIGELYNNFKTVYRLPFCYFDDLKECPSLKKYLTFDERQDYLHKWSERLDASSRTSFSSVEYDFYRKLCLENQFYFRPKVFHYKDDGCLCKDCVQLRKTNILDLLKNPHHTIQEEVIHKFPTETVNSIRLFLFDDDKQQKFQIDITLNKEFLLLVRKTGL